MAEVKYAVVYEKGRTGYGAYVPDLPGCVAVGKTLPRVQKLIREAIEFHIEGMRQDGEEVPAPSSRFGYVRVAQSSFRDRKGAGRQNGRGIKRHRSVG